MTNIGEEVKIYTLRHPKVAKSAPMDTKAVISEGKLDNEVIDAMFKALDLENTLGYKPMAFYIIPIKAVRKPKPETYAQVWVDIKKGMTRLLEALKRKLKGESR